LRGNSIIFLDAGKKLYMYIFIYIIIIFNIYNIYIIIYILICILFIFINLLYTSIPLLMMVLCFNLVEIKLIVKWNSNIRIL
jgi:hypothetical protein